MNGTFKREFPARITRGTTIFSMKTGQQLELQIGQSITVVEDSYGNTYVNDIYVNPDTFREEGD